MNSNAYLISQIKVIANIDGRLQLTLMFAEPRNALDVLAEVDDEAWHYNGDVVPLMSLILEVFVD